MLSLQLLGGLSGEQAGEPLTGGVTRRHALALLALLAGARGAGMSRDKLLAYLWPAVHTERGRHLLSNTLYHLRQALGSGIVEGKSELLRLGTEAVRVDVWDLQDALAACDWERAVALYRGPFLDGFFLSGAAEFEHWVEGERQRLSRLYAKALREMAEAQEAAGDASAAVPWWHRLAGHEPLDGAVALRLMRALAASDNPAGALQHARVHRALLEQELGIEPDPRVQSLETELRTGAWKPPHSASAPVAAGGLAATVPAPVAEPASPAPTPPPETPDPLRARAPGPLAEGHRRQGRPALLAGAALALVLVVAAGLLATSNLGRGRDRPAVRSLAVLPLENLSGDSTQEYFADGITDALITELARIEGVRVTSRTSVMAYKRAHKPLPEIGRALGVDAVVEGTVLREGDRVRITAQLVRTDTDEHLWAQSYERQLSSVLTLQAEVAADIAREIRARAASGARLAAKSERAVHPEAYTHYLKGRYLSGPGGSEQSLEHFRLAIALDPDFAAAWSGLADVYVHLDEWNGRPERERAANRKGMEAARRALALDPDLSEAHTSLAHLLMHEEHWVEAEREYRRALERNPNSANAHILYAFLLSAWERHEEAIRHAVRAVEVDPLAPQVLSFAGYAFYFAGRYDEAIAQWKHLLALRPGVCGGCVQIAGAHLHAGRPAESLAWVRHAAALDSAPERRVALAGLLGAAGQREEGRATLRHALSAASDPAAVDPIWIAQAWARLGEPDSAFHWLDRAHQGNHGWLMFLRVDPAYAPLRADPRFAAWLRRMRLTE
jgi:TolB-like protein/DNA-binding SARP family transcriptional activator